MTNKNEKIEAFIRGRMEEHARIATDAGAVWEALEDTTREVAESAAKVDALQARYAELDTVATNRQVTINGLVERADRAERHLGEAVHVLRRVVEGHDESAAAQVCLDGIEAGEALRVADLLHRTERAEALADLRKTDAEMAWRDCEDSTCRACAKCVDRAEKAAADLRAKVDALLSQIHPRRGPAYIEGITFTMGIDGIGAVGDARQALAATADIAERWVSREEHEQAIDDQRRALGIVSRATYDAAVAKAERMASKAAIDALTGAGLALGVHSTMDLDTHIKRAREDFDAIAAERDATIKARDEAQAEVKRIRHIDQTANAIQAFCRGTSQYLGNSEVESAVKVLAQARDEVGIQLAAAQAEIARLRPVVDAARVVVDVACDDGGGIVDRLATALRALDAVPGDVLAPANGTPFDEAATVNPDKKGGE